MTHHHAKQTQKTAASDVSTHGHEHKGCQMQTITRSVRQILANALDGWRYERTSTNGGDWDHKADDGSQYRVVTNGHGDVVEVVGDLDGTDAARILITDRLPGSYRFSPRVDGQPELYQCHRDSLVELLAVLGVPEVGE